MALTVVPSLQYLRVLLVEDESFSGYLVGEILRKLGAQSRVVEPTPGQALARIERGELFDLVISDWNMPGMDGFAFLAAVHQHLPAAKRLLITAFDRPDRREMATEHGLDGYLAKPIRADTLKDTLLALFPAMEAPDSPAGEAPGVD